MFPCLFFFTLCFLAIIVLFMYLAYREQCKNNTCTVEGISIRIHKVSNVSCFILNIRNINICKQAECLIKVTAD